MYLGGSSSVPPWSIYKQLDVQPLRELLDMNIILKHHFNDEYKQKHIQSGELRPKKLFDEPFVRTKYGKVVRSYYVPRLYNTLPQKIVQITKLSTLKKDLKMLFCEKDENE